MADEKTITFQATGFFIPIAGPVKTAYGFAGRWTWAQHDDPDGKYDRGESVFTPLFIIGGAFEPLLARTP